VIHNTAGFDRDLRRLGLSGTLSGTTRHLWEVRKPKDLRTILAVLPDGALLLLGIRKKSDLDRPRMRDFLSTALRRWDDWEDERQDR
jgi:hypothetical protein